MSRILLTGGAGFIGSHVLQAILDAGDEAVVLDDFSTGSRANLPQHGAFEVVEGSILDSSCLAEAIRGCTAVIHLAAMVSVPQGQKEPITCAELNTIGSLNVIKACSDNGVQRFIQASSSAVYGALDDLPAREDSKVMPLSYYGASKLAAEAFAQAAAVEGLSATSLRFFNVFGPRQDPKSPYSGVISIFVDRAIQGRTITIIGSGKQSRDFIYVGDVARLIISALSRWPSRHEILNVATGSSITLIQLVQELELILSSQIPLEFADARPGDIVRSEASVGALQAVSPFQPTPFGEALTLTVKSLMASSRSSQS